MKRFTTIVLVAASLIAAYLYHSAHAQGINIACTYQQAARFAFDGGVTDPKLWKFDIEDAGGGPRLRAWNVQGVAAPANAAALPNAGTAATWHAQYMLDREADSDRLSRKERAMVKTFVQLINARVDPDITAAQFKNAYDTIYKAEAP